MDWPCVAKEQAKKVPKIFPTNEIARNKMDVSSVNLFSQFVIEASGKNEMTNLVTW
jgi:hypothetical protein